MAGRCRQPGTGDIPSELWWQVRFHAALEAATYVTIRIQQPHLRLRVIEHVAVNWWRSTLYGGHSGGLDGLFDDYCRDVERDVDRQARDMTWELHRVWTNHAVLLGDE